MYLYLISFRLQFEIGPNVIKLNLDTVWPEFKDLT